MAYLRKACVRHQQDARGMIDAQRGDFLCQPDVRPDLVGAAVDQGEIERSATDAGVRAPRASMPPSAQLTCHESQHRLSMLPRGRVRVDDQNALPGDAGRIDQRRIAHGNFAGRRPHRQRHTELRADAQGAFDADRAAHRFDQSLADGEPESGAAELACGRRIHLTEMLEQPV